MKVWYFFVVIVSIHRFIFANDEDLKAKQYLNEIKNLFATTKSREDLVNFLIEQEQIRLVNSLILFIDTK